MKISEKNIDRIKKLCKQYRVKTFSAFGSVTRDDFKDDSDIDFVVDFEETNQKHQACQHRSCQYTKNC